MSAALDLLTQLAVLGVQLEARGDRLHVIDRNGVCKGSPNLVDTMRALKPDLLALLSVPANDADHAATSLPIHEADAWLTACIMASRQWDNVKSDAEALASMIGLWRHADQCSGEPSTCYGYTLADMKAYILCGMASWATPQDRKRIHAAEWAYWLDDPRLLVTAAKDRRIAVAKVLPFANQFSS